MSKEIKLPELYQLTDKIEVKREVLPITAAIASSPRCITHQEKLKPSGSLIMADFRQAYLLLGICTANWLVKKNRKALDIKSLLEAVAGDFHLEARGAYLEENAALFGFDFGNQQEVNQFIFAHLATGGQISIKNGAKVLSYPSASESKLLVGIRPEDTLDLHIDEWAVVHLSRIIYRANATIIDDLFRVQQTEPQVSELIRSLAGSEIPIFLPRA